MKKGGIAVETYVEEFSAHLGFEPLVDAKDAIQLARVQKMDPDNYRAMVHEFVRLVDPFLERNGYAGRFLPSHVNAIRLKWAAAKRQQQPERNNDYAEKLRQWAIENELHDKIELSPLRRDEKPA